MRHADPRQDEEPRLIGDEAKEADVASCSNRQASTFPPDRAQAIGLELVRLSNSIQRDLTRAQTLVGELRGIAYQLEEKQR
jgi:hypothetical protein